MSSSDAPAWMPTTLGKHVTITSGQSPSGFRFGPSGTPYYKVEQLGRSSKYLVPASTPYLSPEVPQVPRGSVIFAKRGAAIALNKVRLLAQPSFMDTNIMALTPLPGLEAEFLYYLLSFRGLWDIADVTSVPQINNKHIIPLRVSLPPLNEQRRLASVLGDVDKYIEVFGRLVKKKEAIKEGLAQELLMGKTRLPGFIEPWHKPCSLADLCEKRTGYWGSDAVGGSGSKRARVIRAGDITADGRLAGAADRYFTASEWKSAACQVDDVVITTSGNGLGKTFYVRKQAGLAASNFVRILRPKAGVSGEYLAHVMRSETARVMLETHTATSAYPNLLSSFFTEPWLTIPEYDEQIAIATTLRSSDDELDAARARLAKAEAIKQGMMQELLTGRTRLPVEAAA